MTPISAGATSWTLRAKSSAGSAGARVVTGEGRDGQGDDRRGIVDGRRLPMGELAFDYSEKDGCWRSEFSTPRVHGVWCLRIDGRVMTGGLRLLPENLEVRKVQLKHD